MACVLPPGGGGGGGGGGGEGRAEPQGPNPSLLLQDTQIQQNQFKVEFVNTSKYQVKG